MTSRTQRLLLIAKVFILVLLSLALLLFLRAIVDTPTWEVLDLLIVPIVLGGGAWLLNKSQRDVEREEAEKNREEERRIARRRREEERDIARNRREQETLEAYFDRMTELLLDKDLRESSLDEEETEAQTIARARTLAVLRNLGSRRRGHVVRFLIEAGLIGNNQSIISLEGANLEGVILPEAHLEGANLRWANLVGAHLRRAKLEGADLGGADLSMAHLTWANLEGANLTMTVLIEADLYHANLEAVSLAEASLRSANLRAAKLDGADLSLAVYDSRTEWPGDFDPEAAGAYYD